MSMTRGGNSERSYPASSMRRPSEDTTRGPVGGSQGTRRPSEDTIRFQRGASSENNTVPNGLYRKPSQDGGSYAGSVAPSTSTSGVVIPQKSTITEEEIQVPYGKDDDDSQGFDSEDNRPIPNRPVPTSKRTMSTGGFGIIGANLLAPMSPATDDDPNERYDGRASMVSAGSSAVRGVREEREAMEQMRSEYEFKIATMQNRIAMLEGEAANGVRLSMKTFIRRTDEWEPLVQRRRSRS